MTMKIARPANTRTNKNGVLVNSEAMKINNKEKEMEKTIAKAKEMVLRQIEYKKEDLETDRKQVIRTAERGNADEIIAWANNMKRTEEAISELMHELKVIEYFEKEAE